MAKGLRRNVEKKAVEGVHVESQRKFEALVHLAAARMLDEEDTVSVLEVGLSA